MRKVTTLVIVFVLVGLGTVWAQSTAPAPPTTQQAPAVEPAPANPPARPPASSPDPTTPRAQTPDAAPAPGDRAVGETGGLGPWGWGILGVIVLGVIVALMAGRGRRRRDVAVDSRVDTRLDEPTLRSYESDLDRERERRRRAS